MPENMDQSMRRFARRLMGPVFAFLFVCVGVGLSGCSVHTGTNPGVSDPSLPYTRVSIADNDLASALFFEEPRVVRDDDGFIISVEVTVRAASTDSFTVDYRPRFKDANGLTLQPESSWRTKFLERQVPEKILMKPNGRNAVDYEILFRWAR